MAQEKMTKNSKKITKIWRKTALAGSKLKNKQVPWNCRMILMSLAGLYGWFGSWGWKYNQTRCVWRLNVFPIFSGFFTLFPPPPQWTQHTITSHPEAQWGRLLAQNDRQEFVNKSYIGCQAYSAHPEALEKETVLQPRKIRFFWKLWHKKKLQK